MKIRPLPIFALMAAPAWGSAPPEVPARLEPVVVTAALRPLPADRRPGGVSVLGREDVRDASVVHLEELLPQLPSLSWAGASSRPRYFQLRGIGELEQYQGAPNPSIGFLVDEIDFSGIGMVAWNFDVEQVEVLTIRMQPLHGLLDADAHLAALEWAEGLLFERAEDAVPHQPGEKAHVQERRRVAPPLFAVVGNADAAGGRAQPLGGAALRQLVGAPGLRR